MNKAVLAWNIIALILGLGIFNTIFASTSPDLLARKALTADPEAARLAITELRGMGPAGLQVLLNIKSTELKDPVEQQRLRTAIDSVAQQRDASFSQLYWYTDLNKAKQVAQEQQRPILTLRMLGRLDEEMSCANSRYFRMALYANKELSQYLREHYILHWQSVRPVPKVSIDFGDGRKIERTITGNSIHYILDSNGNTIEALPGLNAPSVFLAWLKRSEQLSISLKDKSAAERDQILISYHQEQANKVQKRFQEELTMVGERFTAQQLYKLAMDRALDQAPSAVAAGIKVPTKSIGEIRTVRSILPGEELPDEYTGETWQALARLHFSDYILDSNSIALIRSQNVALQGNDQATTDALNRIVAKFQGSMGKDTVYNEFIYHYALHNWFVAGFVKNTDLESLNARVYSELFYTPNSDAWLGLVPEDFYTGIENEGIQK